MDSNQIKSSVLRVAAAQIDPTEADIAENTSRSPATTQSC